MTADGAFASPADPDVEDAPYRAIPFKEVLDERLVIDYALRLRDCLDEHLAGDRGAMHFDDMQATEGELRELRSALDRALSEFGTSGTEVSLRGESRLPSFLKSFLPRSRDLAFIQERLTECATRFLDLPPVIEPPLETAADGEDSHLPAVAGASFPRAEFGTETFGPFEPCDPRWTICLWARFRRRGKAPFNETAATASLEDSARVVIVGDWGSGLPRAAALGRAIARRLDEETSGRDTHVVHLGDTYYVGSAQEQQEHVLDLWPRPETPIRSWAVPGNHDYYSGGWAFFRTLLGDARFAQQRSPDDRPTSIFDLEGRRWRVIGLDTAWKDHDLVEAEWQWLERVLEDAQAKSQRVVLLSHHQPLSAFTTPNPEFATRALDLLGRHPVDAWYWGHEHRCTICEPVPGISWPRCVGNGGVPEWVDASPGAGVIKDCEDAYVDPEDGELWREFAYAIVDLDPDAISARYITETTPNWHDERRPIT